MVTPHSQMSGYWGEELPLSPESPTCTLWANSRSQSAFCWTHPLLYESGRFTKNLSLRLLMKHRALSLAPEVRRWQELSS